MSFEFDHGEFRYTLRQYLLMRGLNQGGEWTDVLAKVNEELWSHRDDWDGQAMNTYENWRSWYDWTRDREPA